MSVERVLVMQPFGLMIGRVDVWPPDYSKEWTIRQPAVIMRGVVPGPDGQMHQTMQIQGLGALLDVPPGLLLPSRPPESDEEGIYKSFRAKVAGLHLAGAGDMPKGDLREPLLKGR